MLAQNGKIFNYSHYGQGGVPFESTTNFDFLYSQEALIPLSDLARDPKYYDISVHSHTLQKLPLK